MSKYTEAFADSNVQAFARLIRQGESCQSDSAYRWLFGSTVSSPKLFDSFADHPRVRTYEQYDGQFIKNGKLDYTTAAGAYQITETTWNDFVRAVGARDFSPASQDEFYVWAVARHGALEDVLAGRIEQAIAKLGGEWASLPSSTVGQPTQKLAAALEVYRSYGGVFRPASEPAPVEDRSTPAAAKEPSVMSQIVDVATTPVAKFALAAINPILAVVPELAKIFMDKTGTTVPERNVAAAVKIVETAQKALAGSDGAVPNAQAVAEAVQSNPEAAAAVRKAVMAEHYAISEAGGGGVEGARKADLEYMNAPQHGRSISLLRSPAFIISIALLVFPLMLSVDLFFVHPEKYQENLRTQIVTGILLCISMVGAFWLGSSFGSVRKDEQQRTSDK